MSFDFNFNVIFKELKSELAQYKEIQIVTTDLVESSFAPSLYSDEIYLSRLQTDGLVYIHDDSDDTMGEVSVDDLRIILNNLATRMVRQKEQAVEIEKFLSE